MTIKQQQDVLAASVLADIAIVMGVNVTELGCEWVEYAEAVAEVATTAKTDDRAAIGRLTVAAVKLP